MASIYSFLQKRKMHESQHGISMVITAYVLSILMLAIGSNVFYNINSEAKEIKTHTGEETQDLGIIETTNKQEFDHILELSQRQLVNPYSLAELPGNGSGSSETERIQEEADTIWLLGNAMDNEEFDNLMVHMGGFVTVKETSGMNITAKTAELAIADDSKSSDISKTGDSSTSSDVSKTGDSSKTGDNSKDADRTGDSSEDVSYSVRVASADKVIFITEEEVGMLRRIVEAEASGEDMVGKILVANVIFNRVADDEFPDNVEDVIFQHEHGDYQFSPVKSGRYWDVKVSKETKKAVERALEGEDYSEGALYFIARKKTDSGKAKWFDNSLEWLFKHGGHEFFK